jgi:hypothetical protein
MCCRHRVTIYFPKRPFLAGGAATFLPATAPFAAGLATTLATTLAAGLTATLAAGLAATLPLAAGAAGASAFFPKEPNRPAFFTGAGGAAGAATFFAPPPKMASKGEGGIFDPGQLKDGIASMDVYRYMTNRKNRICKLNIRFFC